MRRKQRMDPQAVSVRGKKAVVVVDAEHYARLTGEKTSFLDLMRTSPLVGVWLPIDRDKQLARKVKL